MSPALRFTSSDLETLPFDDGKRYEIIDGEMLVPVQSLFHDDVIESPLLPGFAAPVSRVFAGIAP